MSCQKLSQYNAALKNANACIEQAMRQIQKWRNPKRYTLEDAVARIRGELQAQRKYNKRMSGVQPKSRRVAHADDKTCTTPITLKPISQEQNNE